jgi:hypothetical protein
LSCKVDPAMRGRVSSATETTMNSATHLHQ